MIDYSVYNFDGPKLHAEFNHLRRKFRFWKRSARKLTGEKSFRKWLRNCGHFDEYRYWPIWLENVFVILGNTGE